MLPVVGYKLFYIDENREEVDCSKSISVLYRYLAEGIISWKEMRILLLRISIHRIISSLRY